MPIALSLQHRTLESYFFEEIEQVHERTGQSLPVEVEAYVVALLAHYARRTHAAGRKSRALAPEYLRAKSETGSAKAYALRRVGDRALYISGVAPRSLHRTPVNLRYIKGIGEAAYREVAGSGALAVLGMLAEMFDDVAEFIGQVIELGVKNASATEETPAKSQEEAVDLLALVERWRRTQDPRDAKRLMAAGIVLGNDDPDLVQ